MALKYRILVLLFLLFHKLRIKQTARFGNPFRLQTSLILYGLVLQRTPQDAEEEMFKSIVKEFGPIDTVEKAFELKNQLSSETFNSVYAKGAYSSKLIDILRQNEENLEVNS